MTPAADGRFSSFFSDWVDSRTMSDGDRLVGVVGDAPASVDDAIADAGARVRRGDVEAVLAADPDRLLAVDEPAFLAVARAAPEVPVLPVDAGRGFRSVPRASLADAIGHALEEDVATETHPVLRVEHGGRVERAVCDVSLLAAEVAHISEFGVGAGEEPVARFRADGVVVATPGGSPGYARRLDCPVVAHGTGVGVVAPIAPFATDPDHWVLDLDDLRLTVERDETAVTLLADDRDVATVPRGETVSISRDGTVTVAVVPESRPRFG